MVTCNKCGKPIPEIEVDIFQYDNSDAWGLFQLHACSNYAVYVDLPPAWVGDDMSEEEQRDSIRCPHCHAYPFEDKEIQVYTQLRTVMFDKRKHPGEDDIPVEWIREQIKAHPGMHAASWNRMLDIWRRAVDESV